MQGISASYRLYHLLWAGLDVLLPPVCAGCGKPGFRWCPECQLSVAVVRDPMCEVCGEPVCSAGAPCTECQRTRPRFRALRSWSAFAGPVRNALHRLKYQRDIGLGEALTPQLWQFAARMHWPVGLVVPVPLGRKRLEERGYNQVEFIARPLAMAMGTEYGPDCLRRVRETRSQVGLTRAERRDNVQGAFEAKANRVHGRGILLIDDVATTGSTLSSCAGELYASGARDVFALTVARAMRSGSA